MRLHIEQEIHVHIVRPRKEYYTSKQLRPLQRNTLNRGDTGVAKYGGQCLLLVVFSFKPYCILLSNKRLIYVIYLCDNC